METATFAAGCFWGIESLFGKIPGVTKTAVGYTGGQSDNPTYQQICTGRTGHAEAVQIVFDPQIISYDKLLDAFWECHDPTTLNRQGPDIGTQYRSAIYFDTPEQEAKAQQSRTLAQDAWRGQIVTEITKASTFFRAEEYHQKYFDK